MHRKRLTILQEEGGKRREGGGEEGGGRRGGGTHEQDRSNGRAKKRLCFGEAPKQARDGTVAPQMSLLIKPLEIRL